MTAKSIAFDASGKPMKQPGWFSWRHRSDEAHKAAVARYLAEHGPAARRRKAAERLQARDAA